MGRQSKAYKAGFEKGQADGSWILDGNSTKETANRILDGFENGDPEIMDLQRAPLSGEFAGESISELSSQYGIDLEKEENQDRFENGYSDGFWNEVQRSAKAIVS